MLKPMRALIIYVLIPLLVTPLLLLAGLVFFQEKFLFYPSPLPQDHRFTLDRPFEEIFVEVEGKKIHSLFVPSENAKSIILYFHGNAGALDSWGQVASELAAQTGTSVWIMDYPGFGKSEGRLQSDEQMNAIAESFFAEIPKRGAYNQVFIYGRSIGTGPAAALAGKLGGFVAGVILETPFLSMAELIHEYASWMPASVLRYRFSNESALMSYPGPILILHGQKDEVIPFRQGEMLAQKLSTRGSVRFIEIPEGSHNNLEQFPAFQTGLLSWLREVQIRP